MTFGGHAIGIYYEHFLGYLSLFSESRDLLTDVAARLFPEVRVR